MRSTSADRAAVSSQMLLTEIVAQVSHERAERAKVRAANACATESVTRARITLGALLAALPILIVLVIVAFASAPPSVVPDDPRAALEFVIREIEGFRDDYSRLPDALIEAGPFGGDFSYTRKGDRYQVVVRKRGQVLRFESQPWKAPVEERQE